MLTRDVIQRLSENTSDGVLSLYLHVDPGHQPNQNDPRAWSIYTKNVLSEVSSQDTDTDALSKHINRYLEGYTPTGKTLALFATENGIIDSFDLPVPVENQHSFGQLDVVPLLWTLDEFERYLVVLVDSEEARFLSAFLGRASNNDRMELDFEDYDFGNKQFIHANQSGGATGQQGSGGDQFDDMKSEHVRRFHNDVAGQIAEYLRDTAAKRVILGGNEQAAHQVKNLMHSSFQKHVVDVLSIPVQSSTSEVTKLIQQAAVNYERSQELDLVNDVISLAKSGGRGALGVEDVRRALQNQQVELLVMTYPMDDTDLARELTLMALANNTDIELVHGSAAARLSQDAPIAARLYYAVPEVQN